MRRGQDGEGTKALGVKAGGREGGARGRRSGYAHIRYVLMVVMGISVFTVLGGTARKAHRSTAQAG